MWKMVALSAFAATAGLAQPAGRGSAGLPGGVDREELRGARGPGSQLGPRAELEAGRDRFPPGLAAQQTAEQLGRPACRSEDHLRRRRAAGLLPAEVGRQPEPP